MKAINTPEDIPGAGPILALDVDGVLLAWVDNPFEISSLEAAGYTNEGSYSPIAYYNPAIGKKLNELSSCFEVIYCTSHHNLAHKNAGLLLGLPEFGYVPIIKFEDPNDDFNDDRRRALSTVCTSRALAWVEDETRAKDYVWAELRSANEAPTLIVSPETNVGITDSHITEIRTWLAEL